MRVAFIGLGVMGYPMAGHVQKSGTSVCVYNRTRKKAEEWCQEFGGEMADTPAEAAKNCDVVLVCVGNDDDVRQVVTGDQGALVGMNDNGEIDFEMLAADFWMLRYPEGRLVPRTEY